MGLRYLSVCSGIEAATCAWHPLGWTAAAFSEIDRFPSAVLASRFPDVPNLGDMTKYKEWNFERGSIDVLVGGTPCQSFSVAGLRKGMADPRGNLALVYLGIADHFRPSWIVWENVPGVLSSGGGRDFGSFLGALGQLGYGWAYRVLDAQYFGVPQRRRRVFVVGYLGDWRRAAAVLFERQSLRGDSPPSRSARKEVAKALRGRPNASNREDSDNYVAHSLRREGFDASEDGTGRGVPLVAKTLMRGNQRLDPETETLVTGALCANGKAAGSATTQDAEAGLLVAFNARQDPDCWEDRTGPLDCDGTTQAIAFSCKDHGADAANDIAPTLRAMNHAESHASAGGQLAIAYQCQGSNVGPMGTLRAGNGNESGGVPFVAGVTIHGTNKTATAASYSDTCGSLRTKPPGSQENSSTTAILQRNAVRRLTPRECERLQGFPDDWTLIKYNGKQAKDGPRYKAIGNSMAVPVMAWIGERIDMQKGVE